MKTNEFNSNPRFISGLNLANNTANPNTHIDITTGSAASSTGAYLIALFSALTKRINAVWAAGTANGGLDTGTVAASTTYFVHLIRNLTTGAVDVLFSLSATAPTLPTGYTEFRRIGVIMTDGSSLIRQFVQKERVYHWTGGIFTSSVPITNPAANQTLAGIPGTIRTRVFGNMNCNGNGWGGNIGGAGTTPPMPSVIQGSGPLIYNNAVSAAYYVGGDYAAALHSTTGFFTHVAENGQLNVVSNAGGQTAGICIQGFEDITL